MTELIPADQWAEMDCFGEGLGKECRAEVIRQAQLNAAKWGAEQAAEIFDKRGVYSRVETVQTILTAAHKLELPK